MNKKAKAIVALLIASLLLCGNIWSYRQNHPTFPQELKEWYTQHRETVHSTDWLETNNFEYSTILSTETPNAYFCQIPTTGGYTGITVFNGANRTDTLRFKAKADHFHLSKGDEFTYQLTIRTQSEDIMWINIYADTKEHANDAVEDVTAFLKSAV